MTDGWLHAGKLADVVCGHEQPTRINVPFFEFESKDKARRRIVDVALAVAADSTCHHLDINWGLWLHSNSASKHNNSEAGLVWGVCWRTTRGLRILRYR
jgi:hypothetical protein